MPSIQLLPKLPAPPVTDTLRRYLDSIRAVVPGEDFKRTEAKVREFLEDKKLVDDVEKFLDKRREDTENWVKKVEI